MTDLQEQIDALVRQIAVNRSAIDSLQRRADAAEIRADAAEAREALDRDMIAELQRDGVLSKQHAAQMEAALKSSRTVGAAIGIIMGSRNLSEHEAFAVLRAASEDSNRKLRDLAAELVAASSSLS